MLVRSKAVRHAWSLCVALSGREATVQEKMKKKDGLVQSTWGGVDVKIFTVSFSTMLAAP